MNKAFRLIVISFTVIFVVFAAMFGVLAAQAITERAFGEEIYISGLDNNSETVGMINILLIGVDDGGYRSDTIMLISVDGYSNRVNILSVPRDTRAKADGYTVQKINALIGLGQEAVNQNKLDEPEEVLIDMVKDMTGLPIHYFVTVDFDGFKDIIDAVDGVDFNIPYDMNYDDPVQNLHIHLEAGQQHLDGQAAHDFVRFRHNNDGSAPGEYVLGDEGRQYWQQEFIKELISQKLKPKYIEKLDDLFDVVQENVRTNYTVKDLVKHLYLLQEINFSEIGSYQLPGQAEYIDGVWWYIYDEASTEELVNEVFLPKSQADWDEYKKDHPGSISDFRNLQSENLQSNKSSVKTIDGNE